jgi:hypothetical protein
VLEERRNRVVEAAIEAGKILPERRNHYRAAWNRDPVATEALLRELAPGLPLAASASAPEDEGLPASWFPSLRAKPESPSSGGQASRTLPAAAGEGLPDEWFPKVRARKVRAAAGWQRVTIDKDE